MDKENFDLKLSDSSSDSIFITQEPSQKQIDKIDALNEAQSDVDLEFLMNSSKDSAIESDSSVMKVMDLKDMESPTSVKNVEKYSPEVENISMDEG